MEHHNDFIIVKNNNNEVVAQEYSIHDKLNKNMLFYSVYVRFRNVINQIDLWAINEHYAITCCNEICNEYFKTDKFKIISVDQKDLVV